MTGRRGDPSYTPPTDEERRLGYYLDCVSCGRPWALRSCVPHLHRCRSCARSWWRDYRQAARQGLPRPSLLGQIAPHPFASKALNRTVDLNAPGLLDLVEQDPKFAKELDAYIASLRHADSSKPPLRGAALSLSGRPRRRAVRVPLDEDPTPEPPISRAAAKEVERLVDEVLVGDVIDAGAVPRRRA